MDDEKPLKGPHILLIADYGSVGGTRTYFKQLLALYAERAARVTVLRTFEDEEIDALCKLYGNVCVSVRSIVGNRDIFHGKFPSRFLLERRIFKKFIKDVKADVVVVSVGTPELFLGAISWVKSSIYILHTYPIITNNVIKRTLKKLFFWIFISKSKIITVSEFSKNRILCAWGRGAKSIDVVYNTAGALPVDIRVPQSDAINILTVGHVEFYKNPENWIDAAIYLKKFKPDLLLKFTWVGDGTELDSCRAKVSALNAESFIRFVGRDDDVKKYYEDCDIYTQPSLIESLGISVLDAMRYGKPSIVAKRGGLPELISEGENGVLVDPEDIQDMAHKMQTLAEDSELRKTMGKRALQLYEERFAEDLWTKKIWQHHSKIL